MNTKDIFVTESQYNLDGLEMIAYPHKVISFDIELPTYKNSFKRIVRTYVTVDMIKNVANIADSIPKLIKVQLNEKSILPVIVKNDDAIEMAQNKVLKWVMRRFRLYIKPKINFIEAVSFHHPFIIKDTNDKSNIVDIVRNTKDDWIE